MFWTKAIVDANHHNKLIIRVLYQRPKAARHIRSETLNFHMVIPELQAIILVMV